MNTAQIPKIRVDGKKRRVVIMRPTLRKIAARVRGLKRTERACLSRLKHTLPGQESQQASLSASVTGCRQGLTGIQRYVDSLAS